MSKLSVSIRIYIWLIVILAILSALYVFLPQGDFVSKQELPVPRPVIALVTAGAIIILYGSLGYLGLRLSVKLDFKEIWDPGISNRDRFIIPLIAGVLIGIFLIVSDILFSKINTIGRFPHPPFPSSIFASAIAGIGEEVIFRLFFVSFWVWLISFVLLKKKWMNPIFWIVVILSALAFSAGHLPSVMFLNNWESINEIPKVLMGEVILLNGLLSVFAALFFKKYGFLAAVGVHFWTDIVWHVIWGFIS